MRNKNKWRLTISAILLVLFFFSLHGCGESDVGKLKEELKEQKRKREENSKKYKNALNQLAKERKRSQHLEDLLLTLGERLELEGKSLPDELAELRKERTKEKQQEEPSPKKAVKKLIKLGNKFYSEGNYTAAIEVYTSATDIEAENVNLYLSLGKCFIKTSEYDNAISIYEKVVKMLGKHGPKKQMRQTYNNLGWLYTQKRRYNEAELAYLRAIKADPDYANSYYNLGLLYDLHLDDEIGAIEAFEKYMELGGDRSSSIRKRLKEIRER